MKIYAFKHTEITFLKKSPESRKSNRGDTLCSFDNVIFQMIANHHEIRLTLAKVNIFLLNTTNAFV